MATETLKYFSGETELKWGEGMKNTEFTSRFPGLKGKSRDSFSKYVGPDENKVLMPVTRIIEYKKNPSLHKCDARCQHAKGRTCECSCGGKNHGLNQ